MRRAMILLATQLALPGLASAQPPSWESWGMQPMWGFWGAGMMLFMLLFWGVVIAAIVVGIRWLVHQGSVAGHGRMLPWISCASVTRAGRSIARSSWRASATCRNPRVAMGMPSEREAPDVGTRA